MAQWVDIQKPFDWRSPNGRAMKSFPVGQHYMNAEQAEAAVAADAGKKIAKPTDKKAGKDGQTKDV